jgi:hypothetical protein
MGIPPYVPPDVIVTHMIASSSIEAGDVYAMKRVCASFRDAIEKNEQSIVDACFPHAIAQVILGSQWNLPRARALLDAVLAGNAASTGKIASDGALFCGRCPKSLAEFDKTFKILDHLTTLAVIMVHHGRFKWSLARWIVYASLRYLLRVLTSDSAIQAVCGSDRKGFAEHIGDYCSRSIQFSMNPFDSTDEDDEGHVHEFVGLAYEVWLHADMIKTS